jgi:hypothetical protein
MEWSTSMNDISQFRLLNVGDSCSLWNLLASPLLYVTARAAGIRVCCTDFVIYECLHKRSRHWPERLELQKRLNTKLADGSITAHSIELEDLQQVDVLRNRKKLSIGELSVLVFAGKTQQAMLTDDRGAQKLALSHLAPNAIQNTPHLVAWLYFGSLLADADVVQVKADLAALARFLEPHFGQYFVEAQRCRVMAALAVRLQNSQSS